MNKARAAITTLFLSTSLVAAFAVPATGETQAQPLNRVVCDAAQESVGEVPWRCGVEVGPTRWDGGGRLGDTEVDKAYTFLASTSRFYKDRFGVSLTELIGVDHHDGRGKAIRAAVRVCRPNECPQADAFWEVEKQANFGDGSLADDLAAHELTHGVIEAVSQLGRQGESESLREAFADIFGEFADLTDGSADDTPDVRWQFGDGLPGGTFRNLKNPEQFGQPSTYQGKGWWFGGYDYHGVHVNAGPAGKLAYLITDGDTFNGQTVRGIGLSKAIQLWWAALKLLPRDAGYRELGNALRDACKEKAKQRRSTGFTAGDCVQTATAIKAVQLP
ncbi:hypothetical protein D5S17_33755 [Pseudonocardiaceae bacterium YIM PH 21723]|nr:hypothetical protein D5S17_33755 [Pseudonocardiaceae bacterium YIM PH 21723]